MDMYYDENECEGDQCYAENYDNPDEDYFYIQESLVDRYHNCVYPTLQDTFLYLVPLILTASFCNIATKIREIPDTLLHLATATTGICIIWRYANECFYFLIPVIFLSYFFLLLPKKFRNGFNVFLPSLLITLYCELFMDPKEWHKIRGVVMIASMKLTSIAVDYSENDNVVKFHEYVGYMLCSLNLLLGPWTSFENYLNLYKKREWKYWYIFVSIGYMLIAFFCLCMSNCWTSWIISDVSGKWMIAFRDALSFRLSHYFISFTASSIILIGGYPISNSIITKPWEIEVPRSLVQVVVSWNIPMHNWLKTYIFRPGHKQLGRFGGIIMTYLASSLLHGLNFQLSAVLLSLGFYTYIEFQLRNLLAKVFDACIASKQCNLSRCGHSRTPSNCYWVTVVNIAFGALAVFHLAYLGLMFDTSEIQETGYSYSHTIEKWSQLGFASHWVAFATYCAYYLIR